MKRDMEIVGQMARNHRKMQMLQGYRQCQQCKDEGKTVKESFRMNCRVCKGCSDHCTCERFDRPGEVKDAGA
jgi:hypothetical protein